MKRLHLIIFIAVAWLALPVFAQKDDIMLIYNEAEQAYKLGRIEQSMALLEEHADEFPRNLKQNLYRLLSLCNLALDQDEEAERFAAKLLEEDPYYSAPMQDPQRFKDIIDSIKAGLSATITTASNQAEKLNEIPVPATLITEEMIRNSSAQNLQELLTTYVPGMHLIDCNLEINVGMRGIYSSGQDKILIMVNGHRLNSYATNIASPDYSISLEKVKQIEVLRGPASSLYGGVALTGVVNIITKQGAEVDGVRLKAGVGNYGQLRGDALFGKRYFDLDLLVWGSIYKSSGETVVPKVEYEILRNDANEEVTIGRIGNKPSYDFGIQLKWRDLQLFYETNFTQVGLPLTMSTIAMPYQYDKYRTYNGYKPSSATKAHHADLSYQLQLNKLFLKGTLTYDNNELNHYQVISDTPFPNFGIQFGESYPEVKEAFEHSGISRFINGVEQAYGAQLKGDYQYANGIHHKGTLTFGAEYSHFQLDDMRYIIGYDFTQSVKDDYNLTELGKGHEDNFNGFLQMKHQWGPLILNAGMRYDHKIRYNMTRTNELSPRVALILLRPKWNLKLSYSKSFVDAPYLSRKTNLFITQMQYGLNNEQYKSLEEDLQPESLHSLQLTFAGVELFKGFNFEVNGFFNLARELIATHTIEYYNEGTNRTFGVEVAANYRRQRFTADFNLSWINTFRSNIADVSIDTNNNTPAVMSHLVLGWTPIKSLRLSAGLDFTSKQTSYNSDIIQLVIAENYLIESITYWDQGDTEKSDELFELAMQATEKLVIGRDISARALVNLGAEYTFGHVTFGINVHNLFNTHGFLSGMNTMLVPQKGRWTMFSVAYKF